MQCIPRTSTNAERFERVGIVADARTASRTRNEFASWLRAFFDLDSTRSSDLILAINEAMANCAEFAYLQAPGAGTMDLQAWHDAVASTITVVVSDRGSWRPPQEPADPQPGPRHPVDGGALRPDVDRDLGPRHAREVGVDQRRSRRAAVALPHRTVQTPLPVSSGRSSVVRMPGAAATTSGIEFTIRAAAARMAAYGAPPLRLVGTMSTK